MKHKLIPILVLGSVFSMAAYAQQGDDTAVHKAEVASASAATMDERLTRGESLFNAQCAACHQVDGGGLPGAFPPLADSDYFADDSLKVVAAVINGLAGPITVKGIDYNAVMPNLSFLANEDVADIVTYVLNSFGNGFQLFFLESGIYSPNAIHHRRMCRKQVHALAAAKQHVSHLF